MSLNSRLFERAQVMSHRLLRQYWATRRAGEVAVRRQRIWERGVEPLEGRVFLSGILYVDASAPTPGDGLSWSTAYSSLQSALATAVSGDEIHVAAGTYKPTTTTDQYASFQLKDGVALYGGYAGYAAANPNTRDITLYPTILSGDIGAPNYNSDNSYHVVTASGVGPSATLRGFTITGGNASGLTGPDGGIILTNIGTVDPTTCGAGLSLSSASPTIRTCTFATNSANYYGGGVDSDGSSSPKFISCTFSANSASYGGGIYNAGSLTLTNCSFTANSGTQGGGIYDAGSSSPTLTNCTFSANTASDGGGIYNNTFSSPALTDCSFTANSADSDGGGIYNCGASPTLTNCTFTANSAGSNGGGITNINSHPILTNCILWSNTGPESSQVCDSYSSTSITYSDVQGGYTGTGNINADPLFLRNPSPGPDGRWGTADDDYGDLRPQLWSSVVDAGSNAAPQLVGVTTDLAGNPRFADIPTTADTGDGTAPIIDMGAYEAQPAMAAWAGGPYKVAKGRSVILDSRGAGMVAGALTYAWDFGDDGLYDDASGPSPIFSAVGRPTGTRIISLQVTDAAGHSITSTTSLTIVGAVLYVDSSATGTRDGSSWTNAFHDLQVALRMATTGCEIDVAGGTYKPTSTSDRTISFKLKDGVAVYGGYAGHAAANPNTRDITLYPTILSGDIGAPNANYDNSYHVVTASGVGSTAILDGFTITAGNAYGSANPSTCGGGIYCSDASPTLTHCTFTADSARCGGGGIYNYESAPTLTGCTFTANSTAGVGGGIYNQSSSSPTLANCTFSANTASDGGGIFNEGSSPTLTNCTFSTNSASYGGGIFDQGSSSPILSNCIFIANSASYGGGIDDEYESSPALTDCTFTANSATSYGGGICSHSGASLTLIGCTFTTNSAASGGAIDNWGSATLTNCIFIANSAASYGGGIYFQGQNSSSPILTNCTFITNSATSGGGIDNGSSPSPTLTNCILWANTAANGSQICNYDATASATVKYSDIQGGYAGTANINADPLFVRSPFLGADDKWNTADDDYGDLCPQFSSPVVDAGSNAAVPTGITMDIAGNPRFANPGASGATAVVDMGAYEVQQVQNVAPADLALSDQSIAEDQPAGTVVGTFSTTDAGSAFTYSLVSGGGSRDDLSFAISGNQLRTAATFDYNAKNSYHIRARVTDQDGLFYERAFTIDVTDADRLQISGASVMEYRPAGTPVGTLSHTDPDGLTFTYALQATWPDDQFFTLSGGQLKTAASLVYANRTSYAVKVKSVDSTGRVMKQLFTVAVEPDHAPTDIILSNTTVGPRLPAGTKVGLLSALDPDPGESFVYMLPAGSDDNQFFHITNGKLKTTAVLKMPSYVVKVKVRFLAGKMVSKMFTITLTPTAGMVAAQQSLATGTAAPASNNTADRILAPSVDLLA